MLLRLFWIEVDEMLLRPFWIEVDRVRFGFRLFSIEVIEVVLKVGRAFGLRLFTHN
jgi:hypothetical protein